jgi:hypothetical protein
MLIERHAKAPVLTGHILTETSTLLWDDEPHPTLDTFSFRMPRMMG